MSEQFLESVSEQILTERLTIERFGENDLDFFKAITSDKLVKKYFSAYRKRFIAEKYFKEEIIGCQDSGTLFLVIRTQSDLTPIGFINLFYECNGRWMVEYALLKTARGQGYMTEILGALLNYSTEVMLTFKTNRSATEFHLIIQQNNEASRNVIGRLSQEQNIVRFIDNDDIFLKTL